MGGQNREALLRLGTSEVKTGKLVKIMLQRFQNFYSEVNKLNPPIVHSCQSDESHLEM